MSGFNIISEEKNEYTLVSNEFIDHYLGKANDAQIKVYLYLLRHKNSTGKSSITAIADCYNFTEKDVIRALSYWEREGILSITYKEPDHPSAISLCDLSLKHPSLKKEALSLPEKKEPAAVTYSHSPQLPRKTSFKKPEYTLEQLSRFQAKDSTTELIFIAESYLGKTLSANDIRTLFFISEDLQFTADLIDYLLQYCIDREKRDFRYIEKVAINWAENHITTPEMAESYASRYNKDVYTVMNALGKSSLPTSREVDYIRRWYQNYGFTSDIVLEACQRTVLATDRHRFEYADKILSSWKKAGVHHKPDIDRLEAAHKQKKSSQSSPAGNNKFNQFQQNQYDFDSLEKELISN